MGLNFNTEAAESPRRETLRGREIMKKKLFLCLLVFTACMDKETKFEYYPSGKVKIETELVGGKKHGKLIEYYESGLIKSKQEWRDGKLNGTVEDYFESGKLKTIVNFEDSRIVRMTDYFENGNTFQKYTFDSEGSLVDIEKYLETGLRDSVVYPYTYIVGGDTVVRGDSITFKCALLNIISPEYENGKLIISSQLNVGSEVGLMVTDTLAILDADSSYAFRYKFAPTKKGQNFIYGQLIFDSGNSKNLVRIIIDVHYPYFVKESSH